MSIEAMKQMIEALEKAKRQCQYHNIAPHGCYDDAITAGRQAIAEAEKQEKQKLLPRCFADFQPNHEHDRKCEWCAVKIECQTGEAEKQEPVACYDEQGNVRMTIYAGDIQSSVGYVYSVHGERIKNACIKHDVPNGTPLYTSPPQRLWVGLTDEERVEMWKNFKPLHGMSAFIRSIEATLKEKNT